jgi:catechol 2,3-dioxygenase-like lactoylglutathione lyase family enzyme
MLGSSALVAFVGVSDLDRAREFYGRTLGLTFSEDNGFALVADVAGTMLRIAAVGEPVVAPYTVLGWGVADIASTIDDLASLGIRFTHYEGMNQDERGIWTAPDGSKVAWFLDPDGNNLSVTEFA